MNKLFSQRLYTQIPSDFFETRTFKLKTQTWCLYGAFHNKCIPEVLDLNLKEYKFKCTHLRIL